MKNNTVCSVNRFLAPMLPWAVPVVFASVLLPRFLFFIYLGGGLPLPARDQPLYIRVAGQIVSGYGLSFPEDLGLLKNLMSAPDSSSSLLWLQNESYVFGLAPVETPTAVMEPGYPLLLALFFRLFGAVSGVPFAINTLFSLAGALAVRKLVLDTWGSEAGLMAGILWALYPPYVYYSAYAMTEVIHFSMLMISAMLLLSAGRGRQNGFLAGLSTGVFFLFRATAIFLIPLQLFYLGWRKRWRELVFLVVGFCVAVSPWVVRNWVSMGEPLLMPTKGSLNLLIRNNPDVLASEGVLIPEDITVNSTELLAFPSTDSIPGEIERSRVIAGLARNYVSRNPRLLAWLAWHRALEFLSPGGSTVGTRGFVAGFLFYPVMLFGVIGLWHRRKQPEALFLFSLFVLYLLAHAFAHGGVRYRLPVDSVFLIGIALESCCREG